MSRPRHTDPELERVLRSLEKQSWRVERGKGYYKAKCPCELMHKKTVRLTPSNPRYALNLKKELGRMCWKEDQ